MKNNHSPLHGNSQMRKALLTINNPQSFGITHETIKSAIKTIRPVVYYCMADEVGAEGTPHIHLFMAFSSPVRFSSIKKKFPTANIQTSLGTAQQNFEYVSKTGKWATSEKKETCVEGTFEEWGTLPEEQQGKRTDLEFLYQQVKAGATDFEILETIGGSQMRNLGYVSKVRETLAKENTRNTFRNLTITFIWGATATGKTSYVFNTHSYDNVYRVTEYRNPFDNYSGQDVLCLDEYKNSFTIRELLTYLEGYPMTQLKARYSNKYANYTKVYILSNTPLSEQYKDEQYNEPEVWHALLRRVTNVYEFLPNGKKLHYTITDDYEIIPDTDLESGFGGK